MMTMKNANNALRGISCALLFMICLSAFASDVKVRVNEPQGLPAVTVGGGTAMACNFVFWEKQWRWSQMETEFRHLGPFQYEIDGNDPALGLSAREHVHRIGKNQLQWTIDLDAARSLPDAIGGGMAFSFNLGAFRNKLGEPRLLSNNRGWIWGKPGSEDAIEMKFEPALAAVFFEMNNVSEIRAYFYYKGVNAGHRHYTLTLTTAGNVSISQTQAERFGIDERTWKIQGINWDDSPIDLSFLNRPEIPAGKHGFLKAAGDKLEFSDGTPVRFWGTNIAAYALFDTPRDVVRKQAKRLSRLGFNLVRLHHHDSPWVDPNIFGSQASHSSTPDPAMMEKLDWWIKCLKEEGIYVWLDMHAQRFLSAKEHITAFDEISHGQPSADLKGYSYVNPSIQKAMKDFSAAYMNHVNPYTGLAYKNDPAIAAILITNENDMTSHYGNALLPDKHVPWHDGRYMDDAREFAAKTGMNPDQVWHSWEAGPSKYFLNDLEHKFDVDMISYLRRLGVKVPIVTTSTWGDNPLFSLPALTSGNMIDAHVYGGSEEIGKNPLYAANMIDWLASAQVAGMPMSISEWNVSPYPVPDRYDMPMYIASTADHQGWDAVMLYAYTQGPVTGPGKPSNWDAYNDPELLSTLPAAALMYRQEHVREAKTNYVFSPSAAQLFGLGISPVNSAALRTAAELGKLTIAMPATKSLPWLGPSRIPAGARIISDPNRSMLPANATEAVSDTGELRRNWETGIYTIDTGRTQAAMGWIGGKKLKLSDVEIDMLNKNATVSVQSMDGKPIRSSGDIVISIAGPADIAQNMGGFYYKQPLEGTLTVRARAGLVPEGKAEFSYSDGKYRIKLTGMQSIYRLTTGSN